MDGHKKWHQFLDFFENCSGKKEIFIKNDFGKMLENKSWKKKIGVEKKILIKNAEKNVERKILENN